MKPPFLEIITVHTYNAMEINMEVSILISERLRFEDVRDMESKQFAQTLDRIVHDMNQTLHHNVADNEPITREQSRSWSRHSIDMTRLNCINREITNMVLSIIMA